jgi:GT2 family glycosyltransferase
MLENNLLSIIIVNWNAGTQLAEVISSIAQYHHGLVSSVIIVDNASTDDSLAQVETIENLSFQLQIVRNTNNRGFGAACNQGAALDTSEYLLFLNPDTRLFENSLSVPIAFMQDRTNQDVGIVGIQLLDEQNRIALSCARFPTLEIFAARALGVNRLPGLRHLNTHMTDWAHSETRTVDHVIGAFYLIRRSLFNSLGGFDERFFVYLEDLDLSLRAHQAGYHSVFLADAQAFHAGGGTSRQVKARRLFYSLRSRLFYGFKHFSPWQAWILVMITIGVESVTRTIFSLVGSGLAGVRNTWRAYGMLLRDMGSILEKSRH